MEEGQILNEARGSYLDFNIRFWVRNLTIHQMACSVLFLILSLVDIFPWVVKSFPLVLMIFEIPALYLAFGIYKEESTTETLKKAEGPVLNIIFYALLLLYFWGSSVIPLILAGICLLVSLVIASILRFDCSFYLDLHLTWVFIVLRFIKLFTYLFVSLKIENLFEPEWSIALIPLQIFGLMSLGTSLGFVGTIVLKIGDYMRSMISQKELIGSIMIVYNAVMMSSVVVYMYFVLRVQLENQVVKGIAFIYPLVTYLFLALHTSMFQDLIGKTLVKQQCVVEKLDYKSSLFIKEIPLKDVFLKRISEHYYETTRNNSQDNTDSKIEDCTICCEKPANCLIMSCGHRCTCKDCGVNLKIYRKSCPLCRSGIDYLYELSNEHEVKAKIMIEGELL